MVNTQVDGKGDALQDQSVGKMDVVKVDEGADVIKHNACGDEILVQDDEGADLIKNNTSGGEIRGQVYDEGEDVIKNKLTKQRTWPRMMNVSGLLLKMGWLRRLDQQKAQRKRSEFCWPKKNTFPMEGHS